MVSSGLAPYKLPRALVSLLIYQQPSSTTLNYSYQESQFLAEAGLRNETREITGAPEGACCPSSTSSFPEDCARLKLSSARASQAGLKEMMMQMKNEGYSNEQFGIRAALLANRIAIREIMYEYQQRRLGELLWHA